MMSTDAEDDEQEATEGASEEGEDEISEQDGNLEAEYGDEEGDDYEFERDQGGKLDLENQKDGGIFDKEEGDSEVEEFMEDLENDEMEMDGLKLPSDADEDEDNDGDESGPGLDDDDGDEDDFAQAMIDEYGEEGASKDDADEEDGEAELEDVFARANDNQEMDVVENLRRQAEGENFDQAGKNEEAGGYINADLVKKIEQIEDEMMNPKPWQLAGEATNKERPVNSLLDVHLEFNAATKLPPTITKEVTIKIEELIKQRVLDELFDDPVLLGENKRKRLNTE